MNRLLRSVFCYLLLLASLQLHAQELRSLEEMKAQGHLSIGSSLHPKDGLVPGQKAELILEIATDSWFTGGTRISIPEVAGLVILQTEQFANNASELRDGQNWVIQRWSLDVYPQRAGHFAVPALPITLKVSSGGTAQLEGVLNSAPVSFSVSLPEALKDLEHWVAAPKFTVEQKFDKSLDELSVGDALGRTIRFSGSDVMAMMLPTFAEDRQPGLAAYPEPPVLVNSNNRGTALASRSRTISYVAEAPGEYLLPAQDYFWWNTVEQKLEVLTLAAITLNVSATAADGTRSDEQKRDHTLRFATIAAVVVLLLAMLWLGLRYRPWQILWGWTNPLRGKILRLWHDLLDLRKPGLPAEINPGSGETYKPPSKN